MLASAVSSMALKSMATKEGFHFQETLTGFKWLGNVAEQLTQEGFEVLFAFEEAIGFMFYGANKVGKGRLKAPSRGDVERRWGWGRVRLSCLEV
jgi:phosphomannomutase